MTAVVKICGLRRAEDATLCVQLGAQWIGIVLADDSPRRATADEARLIAAAIGARARPVLVFRDAGVGDIVGAARSTGIATVQPHGADPDQIAGLRSAGLTVLRVYRLDREQRQLPVIAATMEEEPILLDYGRGGTGSRFDWSILAPQAPNAAFVAGGITPDNIGELLRFAPWGIDVSSGVEHEPGVKDPARLRALFARLNEQEIGT